MTIVTRWREDRRRRHAWIFAATFAFAPMQCAHKPDPDLRREDGPDDALWGLAEDLRARGDEHGAREALRYLMTKYPSSRHADEARARLAPSAVLADPSAR